MSTTIDKEAKVYQLTLELHETEKKRKAVSAGWRDEVKRIKAEIKDLVEDNVEKEEK